MAVDIEPTGFDALLGMDYVMATADRVEVRVEVTPRLHQPYGITHGGVLCSVVESAASVGAALWYGDAGQVVGVANHTNFLRPATSGRLVGVATPIHRGRTQQLWLVEISDERGKPVARGEVRLANLPAGTMGARTGN
jgi:1,4-dihydroxy-2-naphthoyl-CoA hydrolase